MEFIMANYFVHCIFGKRLFLFIDFEMIQLFETCFQLNKTENKWNKTN